MPECVCTAYPYSASLGCPIEAHRDYARWLEEEARRQETSHAGVYAEIEQAHRVLNGLGVKRSIGSLPDRIRALAAAQERPGATGR